MEMNKMLWPWMAMLMNFLTVSSELSVTKLSSRQEEMNFMKNLLSVLEQLVRDQSIKMEFIGGELHAMNEKMSNDIGDKKKNIMDNISSITDENERQDETILQLQVNQKIFKRKLSDLEDESKEIASNISSLTVEREIQNATILQHEVKQQSLEEKLIAHIERQDSIISQYEVKEKASERKLNGIDRKMAEISDTISKIERKQNLQQSSLQRCEARQSLLERKTDRDVAFSARLKFGKSISNLKKNQKIVFEHITTSHGNAYDEKTGIFHCPKNGLYGFFFNIHTASGKYALVHLTKNGNGHYAAAFADGDDGESDGSSFAVLSLVKGDRVWLRAGKDCSTGEVLKFQVNSFSGFLLHVY